MLYELTMPLPSEDRYLAHQIVDAQNAVAETPCRWGFSMPKAITLRCRSRLTASWQPMTLPAVDQRIRFLMDARVRRYQGRYQVGKIVKKHRISDTDYVANLNWIDSHAAMMGLRLETTDHDRIVAVINKPARPFVMPASRFQGIALVTDPERLEAILATNIGDAKAYGFGFMVYMLL